MIGGVSEKRSSGSGLWLWILIAVIVIGSFFLLLPVYREYGKRCDDYAGLRAERAKLEAELLQKQRTVNSLEKTPAAIEKVSREKFNQGKNGEITFRYGEQK